MLSMESLVRKLLIAIALPFLGYLGDCIGDTSYPKPNGSGNFALYFANYIFNKKGEYH